MHTHAPTQNGANAPRSSTASLFPIIALLSCTGTRACAIGPCSAGPGAPGDARTPRLLVPSSADHGSTVASHCLKSADVEIGTEFLANFAGHISVMVKSRVQTNIFRCIDFVLRVLSFQPWRQGLLRGDGRRRDLGRPAGVAAATGSRGKVGRGCRSAAALAAAATPARQQRGGAPTRLKHS